MLLGAWSAAGLLGAWRAARLGAWRSGWPSGCRVGRLRAWSCRAAGLQGCRAAGLQGCRAAGLQGWAPAGLMVRLSSTAATHAQEAASSHAQVRQAAAYIRQRNKQDAAALQYEAAEVVRLEQVRAGAAFAPAAGSRQLMSSKPACSWCAARCQAARLGAVHAAQPRGAHARLPQVGMGDRACVDLCSLLAPGEGMLVGSFARALFLVHSECEESAYINSRRGWLAGRMPACMVGRLAACLAALQARAHPVGRAGRLAASVCVPAAPPAASNAACRAAQAVPGERRPGACLHAGPRQPHRLPFGAGVWEGGAGGGAPGAAAPGSGEPRERWEAGRGRAARC
jgi:hypothetical protein